MSVLVTDADRALELALADGSRDVVRIDDVRAELAKLDTLPQVSKAIDKYAALRTCCRKAGLSLEIVNLAAEARLLAERAAGRMLAETHKHLGGRPNSRTGDTKSPVSYAELGIHKKQASRWQQIASLPTEQFESELTELKASGREITTNHFLKLAARQRTSESIVAGVVAGGGEFVTSLDDLVEQGRTFATVYCDPPWRYENTASRGAAENHYDTLSLEQICAEPVPQLAAEQCLLHLWTTSPFLRDAFQVLDAWGFEYVSQFVWVKPQLGLGNYYRNSHELLLLGVKGGAGIPVSKRVRSWMEFPRGAHSAKPDAVREMVETISPAPRLEMYGRGVSDGWTTYGNQLLAGALRQEAGSWLCQ